MSCQQKRHGVFYSTARRRKNVQLDLFSQITGPGIPDPDLVHIVPSAARKAAALGLFKYWRVYALLKHIDRVQFAGHSRFVVTQDIIELVACWCCLSPITISRILRDKAALGIFWTLDVVSQHHAPDVLYIRLPGRDKLEATLSQLAASEGVYDPTIVSPRKALLNLSDFAKLQSLEAQCFDAWLSARKDGQFTGRWIDLEAAWGREKTTLKRWLKCSGVKVIRNYGKVPTGQHEMLFDAAVGLSYDNHVSYEIENDTEYLVFQRANTYVASDASRPGKRGICRDVASHLRRAGLDKSQKPIRTNHDVRGKTTAERVRYLDNQIKRNPDKRHYSLKRASATRLRRGNPPDCMNYWSLVWNKR